MISTLLYYLNGIFSFPLYYAGKRISIIHLRVKLDYIRGFGGTIKKEFDMIYKSTVEGDKV